MTDTEKKERKKLTDKQQEIYDYMFQFFEVQDMPPPVYNIAEHFKRCKNTIVTHQNALHKKGWIEVNVLGKFRFTRD